MRKIINTLKYGDKKVKRSLIIAILAGLVTVAFGVLTFVMSSMLCFFITIMAAFITISLVQTFMIAEGENPTVVAPKVNSSAEDLPYEPTAEIKPVVNRKKSKKELKLDSSAKKAKKKVGKEAKIPESEEIGQEEKIEEQYLKAPEPEESETAVDTQATDNDDEEEPKNTKFKVITADTAASYTKKKIKKTLHKYKVMKDHRMVIVDRCDRLHIYQTPAYVWIQDNQFHILLIEEEPRLLMVPIFRITEISYLKKQPADEENDYKLFKKSTILTDSFRPYLPDYNHSNKTTDLKAYKNLYGIFQGIYFTNNSAKNLFDLLGVDFYVEDKVTTSNKVNIFFKEAYKANIKLRDNILDANGYAESITNILDDMAHSDISHIEFKDTLNLMTKNKLITDEYANHYMDVRNSIRG
ncbi:MAG: hypothetical protein IKJ73_03865 [Lachnospiraceae bacterium]|nr:hypothetical protein [Lachnospiraceae bacterium]